MKKVFKRLSATFLAVILVFGAAPLGAFVGIELPNFASVFVKKAEAATNGTCGDNLTWTFNESTGELVISGTGDMYNYDSHAPWHGNGSIIKSVEISDGVTSIGDCAFWDCDSITSITIPDSVISIGYGAFDSCSIKNITVDSENTAYSNDEFGVLFNKDKTKLIQYPRGNERTSYTIPDSVRSIAYAAFRDCTGITSIDIPDSVTFIGNDAFLGCTYLTSITVSDGVTILCDKAFYNTGYYNNSSNWENGVLYIGNHLVDSKQDISGSYTVRQGTKTIAADAFWGRDGLTGISIPDSVAIIGYEAFYSCCNLTDISFDVNSQLTNIGRYAFFGCTGITNIEIPDNTTSVDEGAFYGCTNLSDVYYTGTKDEWNAISIGSYNDALFNATIHYNYRGTPTASGTCGDNLIWEFYESTGELVISGTGTMTDWNNYTKVPWYNYNSLIKSVTIGDKVTTIGEHAFYECKNLTSVTIPDSVISISRYAFYGCSSLAGIKIPDSVTSVGDWTFSECTSLTSVTIPESITSMSSGMFYYCTSLTSVTIPDSVTIINESALSRCTSLESVTIPDSVTFIGNSAFEGCTGLKSITIPDGVKKICNWVFTMCPSLESVTIGKGVTSIGYYSFCSCISLESITVDPENTAYLSDDYGVLFDKDKTELIQYPIGNTRTSYAIPDTVTSIRTYAFSNCTSLESVTIGNGVTSIDESAFYLCNSLTDVYYTGTKEEWNAISIDSNNDELLNATIHYNYRGTPTASGTCGDNLIWEFYESTGELVISGTGDMYDWSYDEKAPWHEYSLSIKAVTISDSVTSIGDYAFAYCESLVSVVMPDGVTKIGSDAFKHCINLTNITLPDGLTSIGDYAFVDCVSLKSIAIPDSVTSIGYGAFGYCINLTSVIIPYGLISIGDYSFTYCESLASVEIPDSVTSIGNGAFENCTNLTDVVIGDGLTSISFRTFNECINLTSVTIGDSVTSIGEEAFYSCYNLDSVILPDSVTSIGASAFNQCMAMKYIHIPSSVTTIENNIILPDADKAEFVEWFKTHLENATEEELEEYAKQGCTKESAANWKPTTLICSDSEDAYAKTFAEENGNQFSVCNGHDDETPEDPTAKPEEPTAKPEEPTAKPEEPSTKPEEPTTKPEEPTTKPEEPSTKPEEPSTKPEEPSTQPEEPSTKPSEPKPDDKVVVKPSVDEIKYGDAIVLHVDPAMIPDGGYVEWNASNESFTYEVSDNGKACKAKPAQSGETVFTATIYDAEGNAVGYDTQTLTAKAGFFQKIIAFFKGLFGLNKIYDEIL